MRNRRDVGRGRAGRGVLYVGIQVGRVQDVCGVLEAFVFPEGRGGSRCPRLPPPGDLEDPAVTEVGPLDVLGLVFLALAAQQGSIGRPGFALPARGPRACLLALVVPPGLRFAITVF